MIIFARLENVYCSNVYRNNIFFNWSHSESIKSEIVQNKRVFLCVVHTFVRIEIRKNVFNSLVEFIIFFTFYCGLIRFCNFFYEEINLSDQLFIYNFYHSNDFVRC